MFVEVKRPFTFRCEIDGGKMRFIDKGIYNLPKKYGELAVSEKWAVKMPILPEINNDDDCREAWRRVSLLKNAADSGNDEEKELRRIVGMICSYINVVIKRT